MFDLRITIALIYIAIFVFSERRIYKMIKEDDIENARALVRKTHLIIAVIALCEGIIKILFDYEWLGGYRWDGGLHIGFGLINLIPMKYPDYHIAISPFTRDDYMKWNAKEKEYEQKVTQRNSIQKSLFKLNSQDYVVMVINRLESVSYKIFENTNYKDYTFQCAATGTLRIPEFPPVRQKVVFIFKTFPSITLLSLKEFSSQAAKYSKRTFSNPLKGLKCIPVAIVDDIDPSVCEQVRRMGIISQTWPTVFIELPVVCIPSANELVFSESNPHKPPIYNIMHIYPIKELIVDVLAPWTWDSDNVEVVQSE